MTTQEILRHVDHTLLKQEATEEQYRALCDDAMRFGTASVCVPPCRVPFCKEYCGDRMKICTVIGFPNGYNTAETKVFETADAVQNGADEIDMVINIGLLKEKKWGTVLDEIKAVRAACPGKILKVIIETCLLTESEKIKMCELVSDSGADYIKTSTGFSIGGATFHDIALFASHVSGNLKIKAAGGIKTTDEAERFLALGADRLGTSRIVAIAKLKK